MKKRLCKLALLLLVPVAFYFYIAERNSWRPKTIDLNGIRPEHIIFSPAGRYLVVSVTLKNSTGTLICDVSQRRVIKTLEGQRYPIFLKGGRFILLNASTGKNPDFGEDRIFSFPEMQPVSKHPFEGVKINIRPVFGAWPDENTLAAQDMDGSVWLWDFDTDKSRKVILPLAPLSNLNYYDVHFLADKKSLYIKPVQPSEELRFLLGKGKFYDLQRQSERFGLEKDGYQFYSSAANGLCVLSNTDDEYEIWNYQQGRQQTTLYLGDVINVALSPDGNLMGVQYSSNIALHGTARGQIMRTIHASSISYPGLVFSADSRTLAIGGIDFIQLWRVQ